MEDTFNNFFIRDSLEVQAMRTQIWIKRRQQLGLADQV